MIKAKRFWDEVSVREDAGGYTILLDAAELKTPYKNPMNIPSRSLAETIAQEWREVEGEIKPDSMPMTKMTNSAIERVPPQRNEVEEHLLEYLENDLLVYRAPEPDGLIEKQKAWDEPLAWARDEKGINLEPVVGIIAADQDPENRKKAKFWLNDLSDFQLVGFYEFVTLTGSFVLAMMVVEGILDAKDAFALSRLDEDFQAERWGMVDVKKEERDQKEGEILVADRFYQALRS